MLLTYTRATIRFSNCGGLSRMIAFVQNIEEYKDQESIVQSSAIPNTVHHMEGDKTQENTLHKL